MLLTESYEVRERASLAEQQHWYMKLNPVRFTLYSRQSENGPTYPHNFKCVWIDRLTHFAQTHRAKESEMLRAKFVSTIYVARDVCLNSIQSNIMLNIYVRMCVCVVLLCWFSWFLCPHRWAWEHRSNCWSATTCPGQLSKFQPKSLAFTLSNKQINHILHWLMMRWHPKYLPFIHGYVV